MRRNADIDILLATYNSLPYLRDQLDSLLKQNAQGILFRILIRDDLSTDGTGELLQEYAEKFPDKITLLDSQNKRLGFVGNFEYLLSYSQAPYAMLCDHDDVWLPEKVSGEFKAMKEAEQQTPGMPILVYTDLCTVDSSLNLINESKFQVCGQRHWVHSPASVVLCNCLSGCTMMLNRKLIDLSLPFPQGLGMHDSYIHMVAAAYESRFVFLPGKYILWRQSERNTTAKGSSFLAHKISLLRNLRKESAVFCSLLAAAVFLSGKADLPVSNKPILKNLGNLEKYPLWKRCFLIWKFGHRELSVRTLLFRMLMLLH